MCLCVRESEIMCDHIATDIEGLSKKDIRTRDRDSEIEKAESQRKKEEPTRTKILNKFNERV